MLSKTILQSECGKTMQMANLLMNIFKICTEETLLLRNMRPMFKDVE